MHNQVEDPWSGRKQIRKISGVKPEQLEEGAPLGPLEKGMKREEKDKRITSPLLGVPNGPKPGLETDSGVGPVSSVLWELKPFQGNEMNFPPTPVPCAETGNGCNDPEGVLFPFTQKVPREAVAEGKQQQWSLSVSRFQPFSPISRHSKQQFSCLQPLS